MRRRRVIDRAADLLSVAQNHIRFGSNYELAHRQAREALNLLMSNRRQAQGDIVVIELSGQACLLIALCLRMRGSHSQAENWLKQLDSLLTPNIQNAKTAGMLGLVIESRNTQSLIRVNDVERAGSQNVRALVRLDDSIRTQMKLVRSVSSRISDAARHELEAINRAADLLTLQGRPQEVVQFLINQRFEEKSRNFTEIERAVRLLFLAPSFARAGLIDEANDGIDAVEQMAIATKSNYLKLTLLECKAIIFDQSGNGSAAEELRADATRIRILERIDEKGSESRNHPSVP
jgi:hypothetical protein